VIVTLPGVQGFDLLAAFVTGATQGATEGLQLGTLTVYPPFFSRSGRILNRRERREQSEKRLSDSDCKACGEWDPVQKKPICECVFLPLFPLFSPVPFVNEEKPHVVSLVFVLFPFLVPGVLRF
jgi:hypothetical protein